MILNLKNLEIIKKKGFNINTKREFRKGIVEFKNPFQDCYLWDTTLTDWDDIYDFIVEINSIYVNLPDKDKRKNIYLNFDYADKCIVASHKKTYLAFPEPINKYLGFEWDEDYGALYGESEEDETFNALSPSVNDLIEKRKMTILDIDLPF